MAILENDTVLAVGLRVSQACTLPALADQLIARWAEILPDPFAPDLAILPSEGLRRWLSQRIATASSAGICAGIDFTTFAALEHRLLADQPAWWRPERITWLLHQIVTNNADPAFDILRTHLEHAEPYAELHKIATRFVRYAAHRPAEVAAWRELEPPATDELWQPRLWRALRAATGGDPVEAYDALGDRLVSGPDELPLRIAVIADTIIQRRWRLIQALSQQHQVDVYQLTSTTVRLASSINTREVPDDPATGSAPHDPTAASTVPATHPLVRTLGRRSDWAATTTLAQVSNCEFLSSPASPNSLLGWLQADIRGNVPPTARVLPLEDRSIQVHLSHGLDRQVEVLRDTIAWLLQSDPTLEPRDIVIVTPDVVAVAPFIEASFQLNLQTTSIHPGHDFRTRVVGIPNLVANKAVRLLLRLLRLPDTRMTYRDLLDLLSDPLIVRRIGIDEHAHVRLTDLVERARIRWGLNARHRASFGLDQFPQSTWVDGIQRLLLGVALSEEDLAFTKATLPVDDVDSSDLVLLGELSEFVSRLGRFIETCAKPAPATTWTLRCRQVIASLLDFSTDRKWQLEDLLSGLARIDEHWESDSPDLDRTSIIRVIEDTFATSPIRAGFGNGSVIVCGIDEIRHVPHRVVCLLGWDRPNYPSPLVHDGDDLMRLTPRLDDPLPTLSDQQALLDAINATTQTLIVVAQGRSPANNSTVPLAAPLVALLSALDQTASTTDGIGAGQAVCLQHPLQASSLRNFDGSIPRSFDAAAYRTAQAAVTGVVSKPKPNDLLLPPIDTDSPIMLDNLVTFFRHPVRYLLRTRVGISPSRTDVSTDQLPIVLDGLQRWSIGDRLLRQALAGVDRSISLDAERRRGDVPPGQLGAQALGNIDANIDKVLNSLARLPADTRTPSEPRELTVTLPSALIVGHLDLRGKTLIDTEFSKAQSRQLLSVWIRLVALAAADNPGSNESDTTSTKSTVAGSVNRTTVSEPDSDGWQAYLVTPSRTRALRGPKPKAARNILETLVAIYRFGMTRPIPAAPRLNEVWATIRRQRRDPNDPRTSSTLGQTWNFDQDEAWLTFFAEDVSSVLNLTVPQDFAIGSTEETSLQGRLARAIWDDLLDHEVTP